MVEEPLDRLPPDQQEDEQDVEGRDVDYGAVVTASDWTTQTILSQLEKGNIDLNPSFQRRQAWRSTRKSQFIESLIVGIPVPQLVLAERKEKRGSFIVIDGKQRLLSLAQFSSRGNNDFEPFRLSGLNIRPELNGKNLEDFELDPSLDDDLTSFENQTIRTVVIRAWKDEDFLYTVFLRLNTGSVQLSPQELRQALHPGPFSSFIDRYSIESDKLHGLLGLTTPDFRMRDAELVIRYIAFSNFLEEYTGNLKPLLDLTTKRFNRIMDEDENHILRYIAEFEMAIDTAIDVFGVDHAFRKWTGERYERAFNRAIFDALAMSFADAKVADAAIAKRDEVERIYKHLCEHDVSFRLAIEGTTKSIDAIAMRSHRWSQNLGACLKLPVKTAILEERGGIQIRYIHPHLDDGFVDALSATLRSVASIASLVFAEAGSYKGDTLDRARAFRLLIHAEIEAYLEDRAVEVAAAAFRVWDRSGRVSRPLAAMLASCPPKPNAPGLPKQLGGDPFIGTRVKDAYGAFRQMIRENNGVKRKDVLRLLVPLGLEEARIDVTWLNDLDGFGVDRGAVAHSTGVRSRVHYSIDPLSDLQTVERLVKEIAKIDCEITELLKPIKKVS